MQEKGTWIRISLINLAIVAFLGALLRYKISYSLPQLDQKNLLHAHSHFAFTGWVTMALMTFLIGVLMRHSTIKLRRYLPLMVINLVTALGMLVVFIQHGYNFYSITFSTINLFNMYAFAIVLWRDLNRSTVLPVVQNWFKMSMVCNILSSFGALSLAYMMATKTISGHNYLASLYLFLHFQYNGFFLFGCFGLFFDKLHQWGIQFRHAQRVFVLFASAVIPAYLLSVLWMKMPVWLYVIVVIAALVQAAGWNYFLKDLRQSWSVIKPRMNRLITWLFGLSAAAMSIKIFLQLGSVIPELSKLAYGFRSIVIGYLHLALLGVITLFLIGISMYGGKINVNKMGTTGVVIFVAGVILNELFLAAQGAMAMGYIVIPGINVALFAAAILLFGGMVLFNLGIKIAKSEVG